MSKVSAEFVEHHVEHHFDTAHQEFSSAKLGMWLFLGQEILFFSALFVAYAVYRYLHPEMFLDANTHLSWELGFLNTVVLLISSFTMVMAVRSAQVSKKKSTSLYLFLTTPIKLLIAPTLLFFSSNLLISLSKEKFSICTFIIIRLSLEGKKLFHHYC